MSRFARSVRRHVQRDLIRRDLLRLGEELLSERDGEQWRSPGWDSFEEYAVEEIRRELPDAEFTEDDALRFADRAISLALAERGRARDGRRVTRG